MNRSTQFEEDETELPRRRRLVEINQQPHTKHDLEQKYGQVWDSQQLAEEFEVIGFSAPLVVVRRKSDDAKGSLEFIHSPRLYFNLKF